MNIKNVTSLEISKQLKDFGWMKETEFWWAKVEEGSLKQKDWRITQTDIAHQADFCTYYPAPLATEILEELPQFYGCFRNRADEWVATPWHLDPDKHPDPFRDKSLPNALGKMWLYLNQKGLLNAPKR